MAAVIDVTSFVHELAVISKDVSIGPKTRVWQFASVIRGSEVGGYCRIAAGAIVDGSKVGNNSIISHCAFVDPGIFIGDDVFIGPNVSLCNDAWPRTDKTGFKMEKLLSGEFVTTIIEDGASVGANAVVLPGTTIGRCAMIAAAAVVGCDVPPWHLFRRDGTMEKIDQTRLTADKRMRAAAER